MIQDQMTLFAAPATQTESPPSRHKQARNPARARTRAADEAVAAPLALPLVTASSAALGRARAGLRAGLWRGAGDSVCATGAANRVIWS